MLFDILVLFGIFLISILTTIAGIGGGSLLISFLQFTKGFTLIQTVPIIQAIIFGDCLIRLIFLWTKKNPNYPNRYLIDLTPISLIVPFDASFSWFGVFLINFFPNIFSVIFMIPIILFGIYKILRNSCKYRNYSYSTINIDGIDLNITLPRYVSANFKNETISSRIFNLIPIILSIIGTFIFGIIKKNWDICNLEWWKYSLISSIFLIITGISSALYLKYQYNFRKQNHFQFIEGDIVWNFKNLFKLSLYAIFSGIVSTYLGIGGGSIILPILFSFGMQPNVIVASTGINTLFSSLISLINFIFNQQLDVFWGIMGALMGALGSWIGILIFNKISKTNFLSYLISFVLFLSMILIIIKNQDYLLTFNFC
jgi:uncharacterized membrane protein YfcA